MEYATVVFNDEGDVTDVYGFGYEGRHYASDPELSAKALAYDIIDGGGRAEAFELLVAGARAD